MAIGIIPAKTRAVSSEMVLKPDMTRNAASWYDAPSFLLSPWFPRDYAADIGGAYSRADVTTLDRSRLLPSFVPAIFGSIRESAPRIPDALLVTFSMYDSLLSSITPSYLIEFLDLIEQLPTWMVICSIFFLLPAPSGIHTD